ncbi:MAG: gamma-glutamylcyclotransferase [Planctomycetaceae bacterium]|nr:gamma-glutamylcyclotransferase [Planctomycetaceae bacterium]
MKLFVYGTLKRGFSRATVLQGETYLGTARTQTRYRMFNCGNYPGLVEVPEGLSIEGELWEVRPECLERLDEIEGVEIGLYQRVKVLLKSPHDRVDAETYLYLQSIEGMPDCGVRWG